MGASRINPFGDLKGMGIELKGRDAGELVAVGIVKLVIIDHIILAEDPFVAGTVIGLRRLSFDEVLQRLHPGVGIRQIGFFQQKQPAG